MDLLQHILAKQPQGLLTEDDSTMLVIDCSMTSTTTYNIKDFKPGTLQMLSKGRNHQSNGLPEHYQYSDKVYSLCKLWMTRVRFCRD